MGISLGGKSLLINSWWCASTTAAALCSAALLSSSVKLPRSETLLWIVLTLIAIIGSEYQADNADLHGECRFYMGDDSCKIGIRVYVSDIDMTLEMEIEEPSCQFYPHRHFVLLIYMAAKIGILILLIFRAVTQICGLASHSTRPNKITK